jgi:hypothetical protein
MSDSNKDTSWLDAQSSVVPDTAPASDDSNWLDAGSSVYKPTAGDVIKQAANNTPGAGTLEALTHYASGAVAPLAGGLTYLGTLGLTLNPDAAQAVKDATENAVTYQPRTVVGQKITGAVDNAAGATIGRVAHYVGDKADAVSDRAADFAGPLAGATVKTGLAAIPYVAAPLAARGVAGLADSAAARIAARSAATDTGAAGAAADASAPGATAATSAVDPQDVIGASAANPPTYEAAPVPRAVTPEAAAIESASSLAPEVQAQREATLKSIGLDEARDSAVTGDKKGAATDYQQSKLDGPGGEELSAAFAKERAALDAQTDRLVSDAQGSTGTGGLDETSLHNRGNVILKPLNDLSDHLDAKIKDLYSQADTRAAGVPIDMPGTNDFLSTERSQFLGTVEGKQLLEGVQSRMKDLGLTDQYASSLKPATVQQAELLKQYLGNAWTPRTGRLISQMKDAIDGDVMKSAGEDIYAQARQARALRSRLLDDPQGVSNLLDSSGPGGINRTVNVERIPDTVTRMPVDQFSHIIKTLDDMPAEMKPQAEAARAEIRAQFALRLQEQAQKLKGAWNNRGVTQYLNQNSAKMAKVFSPKELENFRALNDAGNILDVDRSYPGAAVQGHNLAARLAISGIKHGGGVVGAHIAGPVGAGIGEMAGGKVADMLGGSLSRKAARARIRKLT